MSKEKQKESLEKGLEEKLQELKKLHDSKQTPAAALNKVASSVIHVLTRYLGLTSTALTDYNYQRAKGQRSIDDKIKMEITTAKNLIIDSTNQNIGYFFVQLKKLDQNEERYELFKENFIKVLEEIKKTVKANHDNQGAKTELFECILYFSDYQRLMAKQNFEQQEYIQGIEVLKHSVLIEKEAMGFGLNLDLQNSLGRNLLEITRAYKEYFANTVTSKEGDLDLLVNQYLSAIKFIKLELPNSSEISQKEIKQELFKLTKKVVDVCQKNKLGGKASIDQKGFIDAVFDLSCHYYERYERYRDNKALLEQLQSSDFVKSVKMAEKSVKMTKYVLEQDPDCKFLNKKNTANHLSNIADYYYLMSHYEFYKQRHKLEAFHSIKEGLDLLGKALEIDPSNSKLLDQRESYSRYQGMIEIILIPKGPLKETSDNLEKDKTDPETREFPYGYDKWFYYAVCLVLLSRLCSFVSGQIPGILEIPGEILESLLKNPDEELKRSLKDAESRLDLVINEVELISEDKKFAEFMEDLNQKMDFFYRKSSSQDGEGQIYLTKEAANRLLSIEGSSQRVINRQAQEKGFEVNLFKFLVSEFSYLMINEYPSFKERLEKIASDKNVAPQTTVSRPSVDAESGVRARFKTGEQQI